MYFKIHKIAWQSDEKIFNEIFNHRMTTEGWKKKQINPCTVVKAVGETLKVLWGGQFNTGVFIIQQYARGQSRHFSFKKLLLE